MTELSLIVPCYNEEQNVEAFYARCLEVFLPETFEVVFVNDGSKDRTWELIEEEHQAHPVQQHSGSELFQKFR